MPRISASFALGFAAVCLLVGVPTTQAAVVVNTGSLGPTVIGTHEGTVNEGPGAVSAGDDLAAIYDGSRTVVPYNSALNGDNENPFTIEFWAQPFASDGDDAPVSNRVAQGNRSGWVFFQRGGDIGWNLRMYNGNGGGLGWDLTGGTSTLDEWSHVVATWNGSAAELFVNGVLVDNENDPGANGVYNDSESANLIIAASDTGSPYRGSVDETAFYDKVLTPAQILNHFTTATGGAAGAYHNLVRSDGALLQLSNNVIPEPSAIGLLGAGAVLLLRRRSSRRPA